MVRSDHFDQQLVLQSKIEHEKGVNFPFRHLCSASRSRMSSLLGKGTIRKNFLSQILILRSYLDLKTELQPALKQRASSAVSKLLYKLFLRNIMVTFEHRAKCRYLISNEKN